MVVEQIQTNRFCPFIAYKVVFLFVFLKERKKQLLCLRALCWQQDVEV